MFYAITDELGIMIWQDFMFGCSMYPVDEPFINSVKQEVTHQVMHAVTRKAPFKFLANTILTFV